MDFEQVDHEDVLKEEWVWQFASEAQKRGIITPKDMALLSHEDYEVKRNQFCDTLFADNQENE